MSESSLTSVVGLEAVGVEERELAAAAAAAAAASENFKVFLKSLFPCPLKDPNDIIGRSSSSGVFHPPIGCPL